MGIRGVLGSQIHQEAPFEANDEGERQQRYAGYSSQIAARRHCLLEVQFDHGITPVFWAHDHRRFAHIGGLTQLIAFEPKPGTGTYGAADGARNGLIPAVSSGDCVEKEAWFALKRQLPGSWCFFAYDGAGHLADE